MKYYKINETTARQAKQMWSFSDYVQGSATSSYCAKVDEAYKLADAVAEAHPEKSELAYSLAERFAQKYANHINKGFQIDLMCPSVMISGASNFPVAKKEKQNKRSDKHYAEYDYIMGILEKIKGLAFGSSVIRNSEPDAIEQLQAKIFDLTERLETDKAMNKYYRKHGTMCGFEGLKDEEAKQMDENIKRSYSWEQCPAPSYHLTNIRNKIKAAECRIKEIKQLKDTAQRRDENDYDNDFCQVVENSKTMRIQLFFDEKPDETIRDILKSNGFRWAPSIGAWQRQLTESARIATKRVLTGLAEATAEPEK